MSKEHGGALRHHESLGGPGPLFLMVPRPSPGTSSAGARLLEAACGTPSRVRTWSAFAIGIVLAGIAGCSDASSSHGFTPPVGAEPTATVTTHKGPVTLTLSIFSEQLDVSKPALLRMEARSEKGVTLYVEDYERFLEQGDGAFDYRITSVDKQTAIPNDDGTLLWRQSYGLEFVVPGDLELPPAKLTFVDERNADGDQTVQDKEEDQPAAQDLATEPLKITVRDETGQPLSEEDLQTITALQPVELPRNRLIWYLAAGLTALAAVVIVMLVRRRHRRQREEHVVVIPAHEWAQRELAALVAENLTNKGRIQEFYYRISDIVRGYVERRFHLAAPEMTTEEFLEAATEDHRIGQINTNELSRFLDACDLVKYAGQKPRPDESDYLLKAAGGFVERTRERDGSPIAESAVGQGVAEHAA